MNVLVHIGAGCRTRLFRSFSKVHIVFFLHLPFVASHYACSHSGPDISGCEGQVKDQQKWKQKQDEKVLSLIVICVLLAFRWEIAVWEIIDCSQVGFWEIQRDIEPVRNCHSAIGLWSAKYTHKPTDVYSGKKHWNERTRHIFQWLRTVQQPSRKYV